MEVDSTTPDTLVVHGSIDFYSATQIRQQVERALLKATRAELVIDLTDVTYLSFEGLAALGVSNADNDDASVRIVGARGQPAAMLDLSGMSPLSAEPEAVRPRSG